MKFILSHKLKLDKEHENLLIPYFEDQDQERRFQKIFSGTQFEKIIPDIFKTTIKIDVKSGNKEVLIPAGVGTVQFTFLSLGEMGKFERHTLMDVFSVFAMEARQDTQILMEGLEFPGYTPQIALETMIQGMYQGGYVFQKDMLKKLSDTSLFKIRDILSGEKKGNTFTFISAEAIQENMDSAILTGQCTNYARMLGDLPNNYLHVQEFAGYLKELATFYNLPCEILGNHELEELHSGGILGVNAGSKEEANLITLYYEGTKEAPITALIGKGVMFDSGGYHLKSINSMDGMKYDMCGAANMAAAFEIAVSHKSKKNILLIIPAVENLIGTDACKMGDVLTTMSGTTVEVYNTDAEGRLILCDALTYAIKKGATALIDLATLTYSCQRALGNNIAGIYANNEDFLEAFVEKALEKNEKIWRLPLDKEYHALLYRSQTADLINYAPDFDGGANVAACFLEEFVDNIPWIHLDIVGPAVNRLDNKKRPLGATGVMTASIAAFLQ